ncbi:iron ABC transporter permease [Rhizobium sp. TRM96647]|uniref:FecCD family ABC transporter permease n=1 Tax=unclassified Rhizobium TaxID=2613769 RepID=UPI0021E854CA|nr:MULTISPECIES: iron ABC transporter permease [unclassified Rhizobium]MCV3736086.1 iron ABC transporter permease [Rhizobium sp. TRM96647]MCV3758252.1 iron ABC transporter permease [Rhizobium sp. TRM96650]
MRGGRLVLGTVLVSAVLLSLMVGQVMLTPADLWAGLWGGTGPGALTMRVLRGPSTLTALGLGAVLGISGAIFQILLRNPLAAPDVMGFTSSAGLAVLVGVTAGLTVPMPLLSAAGGLAAAVIVAALSMRRDGSLATLTLILVGIGVAFFASAAGSFLMTRLPPEQAAEAQRWLTGSLAARNWGHAAQVLGLGALLSLALALQVRNLALLELGDELAAGLGLRVDRARRRLAATGVLFAAAGVAVAGPVPFVALMAAPLGARLTGARSPTARILAAAAAGAAITVLADLAARSLIPGLQLPVGVMTGIFGAPYLLWLLAREMEAGEL